MLWSLQISEGLEALQEAGIFYSNMTLADVLLTQVDGNVKLSGFDMMLRDYVGDKGARAGEVEEEKEATHEGFDTRDQSLRLGVLIYQILVVNGNEEEEDYQRSFFGELASNGQVGSMLRESAQKVNFALSDGVVEVVEGLIRLEPWKRMPLSCVVERLRQNAAASVAKLNFGRSAARKIPTVEEIHGSSAEHTRLLEKKLWKAISELREESESKQQEEIKIEAHEQVDLVSTWRELADAYEKQGQGYRALEIHHDVVNYMANPNKPAEMGPGVLESWEAMAKIYQRQGAWHNALSTWEICVAARRKNFVAEEATVDEVARLAASLDNLGVVRLVLGKKDDAMKDYTSALELLRTKDRTEEPIRQILPSVLGHLGAMHRSRKEYDRAMSLLEEALDVRRRWGPVVGIAGCLMGLAGVYQDRNEIELAVQLLSKAETRLRNEEDTPARNLALADVLQRFAFLNLSQRNVPKALAYHQEALDLRRKSLPPHHPDIASSFHTVASLHDKTRDYQRAAQAYKEAADIRLMSLPENHPDTAASLHGLGNAYQLLGLKEEALGAYEKALEIRRKKKGVETATTLNNMAGVYQSMQAYPMALKCLQEAMKVYQMSGNTSPHVQEALRNTTKNVQSIQSLIESHGYTYNAGERMAEQQRPQQQYYNGSRGGEEYKDETVTNRPPVAVRSKGKPQHKSGSSCTVM